MTVPIVQAPMAGWATPALAAAVSNAGALGSPGIGGMKAEDARAIIQKTRSITERPFNVNVLCHKRAAADSAREARWLEYLHPYFAQFQAFTKAISGRLARGIQNAYMDLERDPDCPPIPDFPIAFAAAKALNAAAKAQGSSAFAARWAGEGVRLSRAMHAASLVATLAQQTVDAIASLRIIAAAS